MTNRGRVSKYPSELSAVFSKTCAVFYLHTYQKILAAGAIAIRSRSMQRCITPFCTRASGQNPTLSTDARTPQNGGFRPFVVPTATAGMRKKRSLAQGVDCTGATVREASSERVHSTQSSHLAAASRSGFKRCRRLIGCNRRSKLANCDPQGRPKDEHWGLASRP